jgi:hypothetical protein
MDFRPGPRRRPTIAGAEAAAERLGHPVAVLPGDPPTHRATVEYQYADPARYDAVLLVYGDYETAVATERIAARPLDLAEAARGALTGYRLNRTPPGADMESWSRDTFAAVERMPIATGTAVVDGAAHDAVLLTGDDATAWAFDVGAVRVTVVGPDRTPPVLRWWPDQSMS